MKLVMEKNSRFSVSKLALLDEEVMVLPAETERAWMRIQGKLKSNSRSNAPWWRLPLAATVAVAALVLATPSAQVLAESLWTRFVLSRTLSIQIDLERTAPSLLLPNVFPFFPQNEAIRWRPDSLESASSLAGFAVRKLTAPAIQQLPAFQVVEPPTIERVFDLRAARADLARFGRPAPALPAGIDGARITLESQGRSVVSYYGSCPELVGPSKACAMLIQSRPMVLKLPAAMDPAGYTRFSLQLAGLSTEEVRLLLAIAGGRSVLFLPMETKAEVRYMRVRGADGLLLVYPASPKGEVAYELDWQEEGFEFRLFGRDPATAASLAGSLR